MIVNERGNRLLILLVQDDLVYLVHENLVNAEMLRVFELTVTLSDKLWVEVEGTRFWKKIWLHKLLVKLS